MRYPDEVKLTEYNAPNLLCSGAYITVNPLYTAIIFINKSFIPNLTKLNQS